MVRALRDDLEQIRSLQCSADLDRIANAIGMGQCLVAKLDGRLTGYGCMDYRFFGRGFVWLVHVAPEFRRRGIASRLFEAFEQQCTSARIFTSTNLSNLPMQAFLVAREYALSGMVQHLDEGDPELFYSKRMR